MEPGPKNPEENCAPRPWATPASSPIDIELDIAKHRSKLSIIGRQERLPVPEPTSPITSSDTNSPTLRLITTETFLSEVPTLERQPLDLPSSRCLSTRCRPTDRGP